MEPLPTEGTDGAATIDEDLAGLAAAEAELDRIEAALSRIDDGTYGACQHCRAPIDDATLAADPHVLTCAAHGD